MIGKPNDEANTALAKLYHRAAEWKAIEKWLMDSREACVQASLNLDPNASRMAQGSLKAIDEIIRHTRAAESLDRR